MDHIWKLHDLPEAIVSDRGPQFTAAFWLELCRLLNVQPRLSTACHPQTDGPTKRANAIIELYLCSYVLGQQDDWAALLGVAEFTANNHVSEMTGSSPFVVNQGYYPGMNFAAPLTGSGLPQAATNDFLTQMSQTHDHLQAQMHYALDTQE